MMDDCELSWDEALALKPYKPDMELPEDVAVMFMRKNRYLQELMDKWDLDLEF